MERIKELLSQDKARTAALVGIVIITLAVPITLRLVGQQQDLRQRAAGNFSCNLVTWTVSQDNCDNSGDYCVQISAEYKGDFAYPVGQDWNFGNGTGYNNSDWDTFRNYARQSNNKNYKISVNARDQNGNGPNTTSCSKTITVPAKTSDSSDDVACSQEVKSCPDGSTVGRDPNNNCEYKPCPATDSSNNDNQENNTSTTDAPEVTGLNLSSEPYLTGKDVNISASGGSSSTEYRYYIHGGSEPNKSDKVNDNYNPDFLATNAFYLIGHSTSSVDFHLPTEPGNYYIAVNAEKDGVGCAWTGEVYERQSNNSVEFTGETCSNEGEQEITVSYPEVSNISFSNPDPAPEETITVTPSGDATKYWYYLHGTSEPTEDDPVVQSYSPTGTIDSNTFYKFDMTNGSTSLKMPSEPGTYYVAVNAHSHSEEGPPWNQYDRACAWNGQVYLYSNGVERVNATCSNPSYKEIRVEDSTSAPTPTNTPTPAPRDPDPTGGPTPTNTPTPTSAPGPDDVVVSLSLQMPGIGQNTGDNPSPQNPERETELLVFDENNNEVAQASGSLQFNGQSTYTGSVNIGDGVRAGFYYFKTRFNNTLRSDIQGVHEIVKDGQNNLPTTTLVPGDLDQNNTLDVKDYNIFLSCYDPSQCSQKTLADLNDDGAVSGVDYNILLRSFAIIQGD